MIYSTPEFLLLLALTVPSFVLIRSYAFRFLILLVGSLFFYSWAGFFDSAIFLLVVFLSWAAPALALRFPEAKKPLVGFGILVLAGHLLFWKYMPWVVRIAQSVQPTVHGGEPLFLPLPVGISFFTLQGIAYLVDFYKGEAEFIPLHEYLLFKSFFPQLVAGPIVRVPQLLPQLRKLPTPTVDDLFEGVSLFCLGFFKKIALADRIAPLVDEVFMRAPSFNRLTLVQGLLGYSVQIWADFSGYSDMGIGVARMLGIRLPTNFLSPYFSLRPSEFWRRWHITLSLWIRDYIYIPLGGDRGSRTRVLATVVATMTISGLWHGANWTFLVWGLYHGALLILERAFWPETVKSLAGRALSWATMSAFTLFGWLLFRAGDFATVGRFLHGVVLNSGPENLPAFRGVLAFALVACMGIQAVSYANTRGQRSFFGIRLANWLQSPGSDRRTAFAGCALGVGMAALVLLSLFLRSGAPTQSFIYFQF